MSPLWLATVSYFCLLAAPFIPPFAAGLPLLFPRSFAITPPEAFPLAYVQQTHQHLLDALALLVDSLLKSIYFYCYAKRK